MACVDAYSHTAFVGNAGDDARKLREGIAKVGALPRHILYHGTDTFGTLESKIDRLGHKVESRILAEFAHVRTRMEIEPVETKRRHSLHLRGKTIARHPELTGVGRAQIEQQRSMRENLLRRKTVVGAFATETVDLSLRIGRIAPQLWVDRTECERSRA